MLLALTVVIAVACAGLGGWQLSRLFARRERNRLALSQRELSPVDLNRDSIPGPVGYRRVTMTGAYDFEREIVIRGRVYRGSPGVQIVTPFRPDGRDTTILVNRGFVPTADAGTPVEQAGYQEPSPVRVDGVALPVPDAADGRPLQATRGETWARLDLTAMRPRLPYPVASFYVIVEADPAVSTDHTIRGRVLPIRVERPPLDDGPHLGYAIQWFLIGAAALGFGIAFVRQREPEAIGDGV